MSIQGLGIRTSSSMSTPANETPSTTAFATLKAAADAGDLIALQKVAAMFESGDGVEQSLDKALEYQLKALLLTQEKVNALALKLKEQQAVSIAPTASSPPTSPAIFKVSIINSSTNYKKADSQFLIAQQLNALGITLDSKFVKLEEQPSNTPNLELMLIDLNFRAYEVINAHLSQIRARLKCMNKSPVPLIVIMASNEGNELRVAFLGGELQSLIKKRQKIGELCDESGKPLDFSIAPLYINSDKPRSAKPLTEQFISSHKEEYANVGNDPQKLRAFVVKVLTESLYDAQK